MLASPVTQDWTKACLPESHPAPGQKLQAMINWPLYLASSSQLTKARQHGFSSQTAEATWDTQLRRKSWGKTCKYVITVPIFLFVLTSWCLQPPATAAARCLPPPPLTAWSLAGAPAAATSPRCAAASSWNTPWMRERMPLGHRGTHRPPPLHFAL